MNLLLTIPLAAAAALGPVFVAHADPLQDHAADGATEHTVIDMKFRGTTAQDFVDALRREAGDINVVFDPHLGDMDISPVELKRVSVGNAMDMLDSLQRNVRGNWVVTKVEMIHGGRRPDGALPVWRVHARPSGPGSTAERPPDLETNVWSLGSAIAQGRSPEDVLTAVETALQLYGEHHAPVQLRFHRETGLIMCRGTEEQLVTVDAVVDQLQRRPPDQAMKSKLAATERAASQEIARLTIQLDELADVERRVTQWQTRAELYREEIRELRDELERTRAAIAERDDTIRELQAAMDQLRRALPGTGR